MNSTHLLTHVQASVSPTPHKMALLHFSSSSAAIRSSPPRLPPCAAKHTIALSPAFSTTSSSLFLSTNAKKKTKKGWGFTVRSSLDTVVPAVGQVTEVNKDTFWPIVQAAGDKTVVLDMYTQWCGPCKVIAPKFRELSQKYSDVIFLKLDCNQENRPLAKELGIRVVPTFKILKGNKIIKEVTGAKLEELVFAIDTVRSS